MTKKLSLALAPTLILIVTFCVSAIVASITTLRSSREMVDRYVSVWEEEVARNLLLNGDGELFEKIRTQIQDLAADVETAGPNADARAAANECFGEQKLNITLYGTPAGELRVCRSVNKLVLRSLASPVFAFGLLAGILFVTWQVRKRSREDADRAINDLAIRVAHDIRAPLMALKVAAAAKPSDASDSDSAATRALIETATRRISAIADDLLMRSRPPSHLVPGIEKTIHASIEELVREKKITSPSHVTFETPAPLVCDGVPSMISSTDFERVVSNLIQNAIDATVVKNDPDTAPRIVVNTVESESEIAIVIRDNGIGIPKEVLDRVGEVGFSYGKAAGNGIGISSARRWALERGGNLDIRSLEGTGTEVRLTLPRRQNPTALR